MNNSPSIAVLIPCYQEEKTIAGVVRDFRQALPNAVVYVFDNNCTDNTAAIAREAGATVKREKRQGKGFVVASMFDQVDADIYVMVDGDGTYQAAAVHALLKPILDGDADLTVRLPFAGARRRLLSSAAHFWQPNGLPTSSTGCSAATSMIFFPVTALLPAMRRVSFPSLPAGLTWKQN